MKKINSMYKVTISFMLLLMLFIAGCKKRDITDLQNASYAKTAEVFIDGFTGDLAYAAFSGSDVKAFQVDNKETFNDTEASMRFAVPDANSPQGAYAGGGFTSKTGRDLSGYNSLTFYIKATQPATIGIVGFGNDFGASKYQVSITGLAVNTNWKKVIIPIPDPSKLTAEKGMFFYSAGPENGKGYTFWIDEVRFEKLTDLANLSGVILSGQDKVIPDAETGDKITVDGLEASINLPSGVNQKVNITPYYFTFSSSAPGIASVTNNGLVTVVDSGTTNITATLGGKPALGSLKITSTGTPVGPTTAAPVPARDAADVISMYSDAYTNEPIDTWNTRWLFSTAENYFISVNNDSVIRYRNLNFVGIEFSSNTIDASAMRFFHIDIWTPDATTPPNNLKVLLIDFGANGISGGGDDVQHEITVPGAQLASNEWVGLDIPLSAFTGLTTRSHLGIMSLSGTLPNLYVDNIYFYKLPAAAQVPAPAPTRLPENVLSVFSDSYTNVAGTDFNPNWGQSTIVTQTAIAGNNTLSYANFNYQGVQLGSNQNVSAYGFLHLDYYSTNASQLKVYIISPGSETPFALSVPTTGWNSVDIPLSAFAPVALNNIIQLKFDGGNGDDIYLDNIYFYKNSTRPTVAAPTPTRHAANVISIFSDAYTNVAGTDFNPNWGQSTVTTQTSIAGNNTLSYAGLNYQGIAFGSNQDVSAMGFIHLDYYTANSNNLRVFLINPGGVETPYTLPVPTTGWNSVDIPLSAFAPVALNNIFQMKWDGNGDIFVDNIYFYKTTSSGAWTTADGINFETPGFGAAWPWNVFENAGNPPLEFVANPNPSGINTSSTVAKFSAMQAGQPYAGCETQHGAFGSFKFDATNKIVRIMVYKSVISDVGLKFAENNGDAQPEIKVANTKINEWEELTFDLSGSIGRGATGIIDQIIIFPDFNARSSNNVIYFDNIRFSAN
jgi:hypothetical protein